MDDFNGRTAAITGGGSGIGRALAVRLAREGANVALADVDADGLAVTASAVADATAGSATDVVTCVTDVTDAASVDAFANAARDRFGSVELVFANAGVFAGGALWDAPQAEHDWVMGVNVTGVLNTIRSFVPAMRDAEAAGAEPGHVVVTSSTAGLFGSTFTGPYCVSKFAAFGIAETLAQDLAVTGSRIGVSALCPGPVETEIGRSRRHHPDGAGDSGPTTEGGIIENILNDLLVKGLQPHEVADIVVDALREGRFMILTVDRFADDVLARARALVDGEVPKLPDYT